MRKPALERLDYFVQLGILKPSPVGRPITYCSPMLVVQKPNKPGEVRLVVNYKRLNLQLSRTRHVPAVGLRDFCRVTQGFQFWFRLDLKDAYHQLRLSDRAKDLTMVSTFAGVFEWQGLPQGLLCAGDIFDQVMESVLIGCTNTISVRDDILGGHATRKGMLKEYAKVLEALSAAGLTCDPKKTKAGIRSVKFFGMVFTPEGMKPDPSKVEAVRKTKSPTNQDTLNSFVCMVAWNDPFLDRFAGLVRPLRDLANKKGKFEWLPEHEKIFNQVNKSFQRTV